MTQKLIHKQELHILVGCADARDLNHVQLETMRDKIREWKYKGVHVDFQVIRAAGSFITNDVFEDIRNIITQYQINDPYPDIAPVYHVHIQTHGHLTEESQKDYCTHIYQMKIVDGSPLNCGMLGATQVGVELEQLLIEEELTYRTPDGFRRIRRDSDIRDMLRSVYAYDGYLAGDWIKSIDYLRTHPRSQKASLEKRIAVDPEMKNLGILITAGIQDYSIHGLIRLDGGVPETPWWDEVQLEIRERAHAQSEKLKSQSEKQQPLAGLLCMSDPRMSNRALAAEYYHRMKGIAEADYYKANTVFNISGSKFDVPETPFGAYVVAGFYYAVKYLGLTDQMVMGYDERQTQRIIRKIGNDPIMDLVVKKFNVNLMPLNQVDLV
jgi:hypothetical protein